MMSHIHLFDDMKIIELWWT